MPRLVRRQPLAHRIQSYLNPVDLLLRLSEEVESHGWDQFEKEQAIPIGVALNLIFLAARANSRDHGGQGYDDVFGDGRLQTGWFGWLVSFALHFLTLLSFVNGAYTFWRKRHYRLFEAPIDAVPSTPSAQRVRVNSSPISSSPLKFLSNIMAANEPRSRAHADSQRDVWELAVWDPLPTCLRLFCYFSPGHVLIYWLFLPTAIADPRPSVTIVTTIIVSFLLSVQLSTLQSSFSQQSKDLAVISKETLHEYDTKFVHPRTQPCYRDVGTQFSEQASYRPSRDERYNFVETHTPTVVINRGFKTNPNPNYSKYTDPDGAGWQASQSRPSTSLSTPSLPPTAQQQQPFQTPSRAADSSSPIRPHTALRQPQFRPGAEMHAGRGGSLGVYTHADSPLKKKKQQQQQQPQVSPFPAFGNNSDVAMRGGGDGYMSNYARDGRRSLSPEKQLSQLSQVVVPPPAPQPPSPGKRLSVPATGINTLTATKRWGHLQQSSNARRESGRL